MEDKVNSLKRENTAQKRQILWFKIQSITEPIREEKVPDLTVKLENVKNVMKSVEYHPLVYLLKQYNGMVETIHLN